ncbi:MAG: sugar ABC transporter substrate-binding protein [Microbacteriaceae bacterium]|nr:sugar ABC transporter substrate-binding protein [Microbacteriaceae bacterium]
MNVYSRRIVGAVAAVACVAAVSACSPAADDSGPITLRFWTNLNVAAQASVIQAQATACTVGMDNVSLEFEAIPFGDMYTKLATAFRSGEGPDIMNTNEGAVSFAQDADYLVPVDDIIDAHGRDDFLPSYLGAVQKDGKTWGVPDWALHQEVWYRTDLFEEAGIEVPTTWDELLAAAEAVDQGEGGIRGFAVPMSSVQVAPQTLYQFLYANHVYTFDPKTGDYAFDADLAATTESVQFMLDLYRAASPAESRTWAWNDFRNAFAEGKLAMTNDFGAVVGLIQSNNPDLLDKVSAFPMPTPDGSESGGMLGGGYYYMLGKTGDARQAAASKLVACMLDPELAAGRANTRPVFAIPAMISAAETSTYTTNPTVQQFADEIAMIREQQSYRYGMEAGLNPLAGQIEATTFIGDALQAAAVGDITTEEAVEQINSELKRLAGV